MRVVNGPDGFSPHSVAKGIDGAELISTTVPRKL